jgi:trehalose synthase-fused probable maltokinase
MTAYVGNRGDLWTTAVDTVARSIGRAAAATDDGGTGPRGGAIDDAVDDDRWALLGRRTAELHRQLAIGRSDAFAPAALRAADQDALRNGLWEEIDRTLDQLASRREDVPPVARVDAGRLLDARPMLRELAERVATEPIEVDRIRIHGDLHLGQVLETNDGDLVIIDFEGEPARPLEWRRRKHLALVDVAGMVRSLHYAAHESLRRLDEDDDPEGPARNRQQLAVAWQRRATERYVSSYVAEAGNERFIPRSRRHLDLLLDHHMLAKALYEVRYELDHRPDWVPFPVRGALDLIDSRS